VPERSASGGERHGRAGKIPENGFRTVFESSPVGLAILDLAGRPLRVNPALAGLLQRDEAELSFRETRRLVHPDELARLATLYTQLVDGAFAGLGDDFRVSLRLLRSDGEPVWTDVAMRLVRAGDDVPDYVIATVQDNSELQLLRNELGRQSTEDAATGLANASRFHGRLEEMLAAQRPGTRLALCYIDLDGFRVVNDGLGREAGDQLLNQVARVLAETFRGPGNLVARVLGDGFAVLVDNPESPAQVIATVEEFLARMEEPFWLPGLDAGVAVSASVGIVVHPAEDLGGADELIRAAEITLHRAKAGGKAQWMLYEQDLDHRDRTRFRLAAIMPGALENGQFEVVYRAVTHPASGLPVMAYSTVRWNREGLGALGPREFLGLAEETGLIVPLGKWVLEQVCKHAAHWHQRFGASAPRVGLSITARLSRDQNLLGTIQAAMLTHEVSPDWLTVAMPAACLTGGADRLDDAAESLQRLVEIGVRGAAEGFGAGQASLLDLRGLPLTSLLLAHPVAAAVREASSPELARSLRDTVELAHARGIEVIAFGCNDEKAAARLRDCGVDGLAGRAFGGTYSASELEELWHARGLRD
jgi:diguanylate cyclase (GGDEF)-like protein/PAS domain S-box-containing protein